MTEKQKKAAAAKRKRTLAANKAALAAAQKKKKGKKGKSLRGPTKKSSYLLVGFGAAVSIAKPFLMKKVSFLREIPDPLIDAGVLLAGSKILKKKDLEYAALYELGRAGGNYARAELNLSGVLGDADDDSTYIYTTDPAIEDAHMDAFVLPEAGPGPEEMLNAYVVDEDMY